MKSQRNIALRLLGLILAIVGLMSWNTLSVQPMGQTAEATTNTGRSKLTDDPASSAHANGRIAFVSVQGNNTEIHTMNADGGDRMRLTSGPSDLDPAWSPVGTQIAFVRAGAGGGIFVMDADGSNQRQLTQSFIGRYPAWSPDGTKIAFSSSCSGCVSGVVYIMNADGSDQRIISQSGSQTAWSPDGSKLATTGADYALYLVKVDGGDKTRITEPPRSEAEDTDPAWSPGGSKIAFTRWTGCDFNDCYDPEIWTVNPDGSNPRFLGVYGYGLDWSPDGTKIIFSDDGDLLIMNPDGSGITNVTNTKGEREFGPSWQPLLLSCADSISPTGQSFDANGGVGTVDVTAGSECAWTAASYAGWITVASASTSGNGSVAYSVAANTSTSSRTSNLIVADRVFSVTQAGLPVRIVSASVAGKKLFVLGENFDPGAVILLNGEEQATKNDGQNPRISLIGKKTGKKIKPGDKLQVRNANGTVSQEFTFMGP